MLHNLCSPPSPSTLYHAFHNVIFFGLHNHVLHKGCTKILDVQPCWLKANISMKPKLVHEIGISCYLLVVLNSVMKLWVQ
jgi:hypothetical protein